MILKVLTLKMGCPSGVSPTWGGDLFFVRFILVSNSTRATAVWNAFRICRPFHWSVSQFLSTHLMIFFSSTSIGCWSLLLRASLISARRWRLFFQIFLVWLLVSLG